MDKANKTDKSLSLDCIFRPKTIAVIGASKRRGSIGREIFGNLLEFGFEGMVFPVNPKSNVVNSMKCYRSVLEIPEPVDLAIIVVPKRDIMRVVEECGLKGVGGLVVITAGFKEVGGAGIELENELKERIRKYGMRMVGPNCMGVINTQDGYGMHATFSSVAPIKGNVGFMSQSGALGVAILAKASNVNLGTSMFISLGNKMDILANDMLEYWENDDNTKVILMYLESFGNPRIFTKVARRIVKKKPLVAVKAGRTGEGAKAASSHTGALAGMDVATDALFEQCGVLRVSSVEELFDVGQALIREPVSKGNRVAIITNAGGPGIMATDACVNQGLELAKLTGITLKKLVDFLPDEASLSNPVDMIAGAGPIEYKKGLDVLIKDKNVDAVIVIFVHPMNIDATGVAKSIISIHEKKVKKPILCCFMGKEHEYSGIGLLRKNQIPVYLYPESAARALSALVEYRKICEREKGIVVKYEVDKETVQEIIDKAKMVQRKFLKGEEVAKCLNAYGIPMAPFKLVNNKEEAIKFAEEAGYPVVLKLMSTAIIHKTDVGGVILDIRTKEELEEAYINLIRNVKEKVDTSVSFKVMVQKMIKGGKETIIGMSLDPSFGPLIMFGLGGIYVEIFKDITYRINPITDRDSMDMIKSLRSFSILKGVRGEEAIDLDIIAETIQRVSQLISDFDCIKELDINPFLVFPERESCMGVDARIAIDC